MSMLTAILIMLACALAVIVPVLPEIRIWYKARSKK
jgi:hypothetical protein